MMSEYASLIRVWAFILLLRYLACLHETIIS